MTTSYKELLKQRETLDAQIQQARAREVSDALDRVRQTVAEFGLSVAEVFPSERRGRVSVPGVKVAPKYRNPATGQTWTGRGKPPKWIQGQDRAQFVI